MVRGCIRVVGLAWSSPLFLKKGHNKRVSCGFLVTGSAGDFKNGGACIACII